jgi:hypothetical protein
MSGTGLLLVAAVAGYWLLERAQTHQGGLRVLGRVLGALIIIVALMGTACKVFVCMGSAKSGMCPLKPGFGLCPIAPKGAVQPAEPAQQ